VTPRSDEIAVGAAAPPRTTAPLTVADFVRYAGASGDFNPLHYDEAHARGAGFASTFAQGMLSAGLLGSYVADWLGPAGLRRFQVRFVDVVWPGDSLTSAATVTRAYDRDGERLVDVELSATRQTGAVAVSGTATFALIDDD
jgi:acyl dehydratase